MSFIPMVTDAFVAIVQNNTKRSQDTVAFFGVPCCHLISNLLAFNRKILRHKNTIKKVLSFVLAIREPSARTYNTNITTSACTLKKNKDNEKKMKSHKKNKQYM